MKKQMEKLELLNGLSVLLSSCVLGSVVAEAMPRRLTCVKFKSMNSSQTSSSSTTLSGGSSLLSSKEEEDHT